MNKIVNLSNEEKQTVAGGGGGMCTCTIGLGPFDVPDKYACFESCCFDTPPYIGFIFQGDEDIQETCADFKNESSSLTDGALTVLLALSVCYDLDQYAKNF